MKNKKVFKIAFSAIMLSLAIVFEILCKVIPFFQKAFGGGFSLAMLPLVIAAVVCGFYHGLAIGILYGIIDCFLIDCYGFILISFILDYIIGFSGVAILGLFRKQIIDNKKRYFVLGFIIALLIRWIASGFSGVINASVWGYDKDFLEGVFGAGNGGILWLYLYSFVIYNLPYIAISGTVCIIIALSFYKVLFLNEQFIESK